MGTALSCDGASDWTVLYDAYDLGFSHADCVVFGPGASAACLRLAPATTWFASCRLSSSTKRMCAKPL